MSDIAAAVRHVRRGVRLAQIDPRSTPGFDGDKAAGKALLAERAEHLAQLQERLFAASSAGDGRSVLLLLQGMDTAGKGGLVRHVVGEVDPQGVRITSFKAPTRAERRHDFLWRIERALPGPGQIGVFDRSHYEDVLIHRVRGLSRPEVIEERYGRIVEFERRIADAGIHLVKVMPHISYEEQGERLLERLDRPDKHWKYNPGDVDERMLWDDYQRAYAIAIDRTARAAAPWHVVPADRKWYARLAVQELLIDALERIDPQWPAADYDVDAERERLVALGGIDAEVLAASLEARADAADADGAGARDGAGDGTDAGHGADVGDGAVARADDVVGVGELATAKAGTGERTKAEGAGDEPAKAAKAKGGTAKGAKAKGAKAKAGKAKAAKVKGAKVKGAKAKGAKVKGAKAKGAKVKGAKAKAGTAKGGKRVAATSGTTSAL
ncbi:hypothetical protein GCM10009846_16820 [Agrococcus versicolor]|uniref:Polyphosphate kinase-2-related domain-containing protein n=1 Tax=Agrococcus versicolor TaxID=501482 RepID=A0ABN3AQZ9_9MICO